MMSASEEFAVCGCGTDGKMRATRVLSISPDHWRRSNAFFDISEKTRRAEAKPGFEQLYESTWRRWMPRLHQPGAAWV
jgi:hypothetical protein